MISMIGLKGEAMPEKILRKIIRKKEILLLLIYVLKYHTQRSTAK